MLRTLHANASSVPPRGDSLSRSAENPEFVRRVCLSNPMAEVGVEHSRVWFAPHCYSSFQSWISSLRLYLSALNFHSLSRAAEEEEVDEEEEKEKKEESRRI